MTETLLPEKQTTIERSYFCYSQYRTRLVNLVATSWLAIRIRIQRGMFLEEKKERARALVSSTNHSPGALETAELRTSRRRGERVEKKRATSKRKCFPFGCSVTKEQCQPHNTWCVRHTLLCLRLGCVFRDEPACLQRGLREARTCIHQQQSPSNGRPSAVDKGLCNVFGVTDCSWIEERDK